MFRLKNGPRGGSRASALWGTGNRGGESRSSALWGKGSRGLVTMIVAMFVLGVPLAASSGGRTTTIKAKGGSYVSPALLTMARTNPTRSVRVIIESRKGAGAAKKALDFLNLGMTEKFGFIDSVTARVPAGIIPELAKIGGLTITQDAVVEFTTAAHTSTQLWPFQNGVDKLWGTALKPAPKAPTIAIVDSGINKDLPCFGNGSRIVARQVLTKLSQDNSKPDGRGHGSFVAGIAACEAAGYAGAAPNADIVDLDVMDDQGRAYTSDVIAAAEWILKNKDAKNIRVANFSLHSTAKGPFTKDPLNKAVMKLWFNGVFVVAAAGNYGSPTGPSGVVHAPGNNPFVMTVGALDLNGTVGLGNDQLAPWSAYGRTEGGFAKPEVVAAGRYMVGPIPADSTLASEKAVNITAPGYIQLSGTSFAAPVVSGIAAQILARYPKLTPDEVKGAIMAGARPVPHATALQAGVGEVTATKAVSQAANPTANPNKALNRFIVTDSLTNEKSFNATSWESEAQSNLSWDSTSWESTSWSSLSWDSTSWSSLSWESISWSDLSWTDMSVADTSWADNALGDANADGGYALTLEELAAAAADPDLALPETDSGTTSTTDGTALNLP